MEKTKVVQWWHIRTSITGIQWCKRSLLLIQSNVTDFSVAGACFDARTIPESYVFLRDLADVPY